MMELFLLMWLLKNLHRNPGLEARRNPNSNLNNEETNLMFLTCDTWMIPSWTHLDSNMLTFEHV